MTNLAVPENLIELTVCRCRKKCINNTCHCRKASLSWIESCSCEESCMDQYKEDSYFDPDESDQLKVQFS